MRLSRTRALAALVMALALLFLNTTCSGGGGGSSNPGPPPPPTSQDYVVFAWNDLGMHCLNPTYDHAVILPPYNNVWAQVIQRGNPPKVVTTDLRVEYRILDNTYSYGKSSNGNWNFSQFWDNMLALFNTTRPANKGLNLVDPSIQNGLTGSMTAVGGDHFQADGIPVTPINDSDLGTENPYQIAEVTVQNASGTLLARTRATVPTSFEINCGLCHADNPDPLVDVINRHNARPGTTVSLSTTEPVLCASCHGSPALGGAGAGSSGTYLSQAVHGFHATRTAPTGAAITCYNCHPGATAKCNRSLHHTGTDGNCVTCHGSMAEVASSITASPSPRTPWVSQKSTCATCHNVPGAIPQVDTGTTLYRHAKGHGQVYCASCHGSPHAMVPSSQSSDDYQAIQYMGSLPSAGRPEKSMGSCGVCHGSSRPTDDGSPLTPSEFAGSEHGSGERPSACSVCHTGFTQAGTASNWPHGFQWKAR